MTSTTTTTAGAARRDLPGFEGSLIGPEDSDYDEARSVYNAMIDRRPALIARCADAADVIAAVAFARDHGLRSPFAAAATTAPGWDRDDGVVIDLSPMSGVRVDPVEQHGARRRRLHLGRSRPRHPRLRPRHARAGSCRPPASAVSPSAAASATSPASTGSPSTTCSSADVVLADGSFVTATRTEHPDLFWALRGGGGNFGVVTSFTFRLHPVDNGRGRHHVWPVDQTPEVLRWYREFLPQAPEDLNGFFAVLTVPPGPPFPEELHGHKMCGVVWCYGGGEPEQIDKELAAGERRAGSRPSTSRTPMPYPALQTMFDALIPPGLQWYWRGGLLRPDHRRGHRRSTPVTARIPTELSTMHLYPVDGAAHRVGPDDTAWSYRDARWSERLRRRSTPTRPTPRRSRRWTVDYWEALHPHSTGRRVRELHDGRGPGARPRHLPRHYDRLSRAIKRLRPGQPLPRNQNIEPAH